MAFFKRLLVAGGALALLAFQNVTCSTEDFVAPFAALEERASSSPSHMDVPSARREETDTNSAQNLQLENSADAEEAEVPASLRSFESERREGAVGADEPENHEILVRRSESRASSEGRVVKEEGTAQERPAAAGRVSGRALVRQLIGAVLAIPLVWEGVRRFFFRLGGMTAGAIDSATDHAAYFLLRRRIRSRAQPPEAPQAATARAGADEADAASAPSKGGKQD